MRCELATRFSTGQSPVRGCTFESRRVPDTNTMRLIKASVILPLTARRQPYAWRVFSCRAPTGRDLPERGSREVPFRHDRLRARDQ